MNGESKSPAALRLGCSAASWWVNIYQPDKKIQEILSGYKTIQQTSSQIDARAEIVFNNISFRVKDRWSLDGAVISIQRTVDVVGNAPGGFNSSLALTVDSSCQWADVNILVPGALFRRSDI